jgi:cob(I)alamin adenosyltransferase
MSEIKKGLLIVYTGNGKGKTTAALGAAFRAMGRNWKVGMVQFIKGKWMTGERIFAENLPLLDLHVMGQGFTWESDDLSRDKDAAERAWQRSKDMMHSGDYPLVILDEITYAIHYNFITSDDVLDEISRRPEHVHVILTGRNAPKDMLAAADLVSEIQSIKHPFDKGERARMAIDY